MAKKVVSIVKNNKKEKKNSTKTNEIFNLNEEIIIGINSKKDIEKNKEKLKQNKKKKDKKKNKKKEKNNPKIKEKNNPKIKEKNNPKIKEKITPKTDKNINKKEIKVKRKSHKILKILGAFLIFIIICVAFLLSPLFNISKITVKNNNKLTAEEIISFSGITMGENIFKYIDLNIMNNVKENSYIKEVNIVRIYPSEIIIEVVEREMVYSLKVGETYAYIDNQGYVVEITNENLNFPEFVGYKTDASNIIKGNRLIEEDLKNLEKMIEIYNYAQSNEISNEILSFNFEKSKVIIKLKGDRIAYMENLNNLNIKMLSLKIILERNEGKAGEIYLDGQGASKSALFREKV